MSPLVSINSCDNKRPLNRHSQRFILIFVLISTCLVPFSLSSSTGENEKPSEAVVDQDPGASETIFVFPSMQMSNVASLAHAQLSDPSKIRVNYRGDPKKTPETKKKKKERVLYPTPLPNSIKKEDKVKRRPNNFVKGTTITPATWNPDNIDHTVNPNKSRKPVYAGRTTPIPKQRFSHEEQDDDDDDDLIAAAATTTASSALKVKTLPAGNGYTKVDPKYKNALSSSFDYKEWRRLKESFLKKEKPATTTRKPHTKFEIIEVTKKETIVVPTEPSVKPKSGQIIEEDEEAEEDKRTKKEVPSFPNFPDHSGEKQQQEHESEERLNYNVPTREEMMEKRRKNRQKPRVPRDFSVNQVVHSAEAVSVHHSSGVTHDHEGQEAKSASDPQANSYQSITIVHPKDDDDRPPPKVQRSYMRPKKTYIQQEKKSITTTTMTTRAPFLPSQITLHTTARPGKEHLPPHLKNKDTVILNLPKMKPTDIPDGYELIPLSQLTPEYEVVPWEEAKDVLNVSVSSLGRPKRKDYSTTSTISPYQLGPREPQSGYASTTIAPGHHHHPHVTATTATASKAHYETGSSTASPFDDHHNYYPSHHVSKLPRESQSGYAFSTTPKPFPPKQYHDTREWNPPPVQNPNDGYRAPQSGYKPPPVSYQPQKEVSWFKPPPISPDLPPLFYEDKPKMKEATDLFGEEEGNTELPPIVKSLDFRGNEHHHHHHHHPNVIHFGTDFGPKLIPVGNSEVNGKRVKNPYLKTLHPFSIQTTKSPYPVKALNTPEEDLPAKYGPSERPYHIYSTPSPTTTKRTTTTPKPKPITTPFSHHSTVKPHFRHAHESHHQPYHLPEATPKPKYEHPSPKPYHVTTPKPSYSPVPRVTYSPTPKPVYSPPTPEPAAYSPPSPEPTPKSYYHASSTPKAPLHYSSPSPYAKPVPQHVEEVRPSHEIRHHGTPSPIPAHKTMHPETSDKPRLIPLSHHAPPLYHSTGPPATTPTTAPTPYRHWTSPNEINYSPTPGSYVKIKYASTTDKPSQSHVKTLAPSAAPPAAKTTFAPKHHHHPHNPAHFVGTARPPYHLPSASPAYYNGPPAKTRKPSYVKELSIFSHHPHHVPPAPEMPLYMPTSPKPASGFKYDTAHSNIDYDNKHYSPVTPTAAVKSLPYLGHASTFAPPGYREKYPPKRSYDPESAAIGENHEIPVYVNHFPTPSPVQTIVKQDFYTSPRPVYKPGSPVKQLPDGLPEYNAPYRSSGISRAEPESREHQQEFQGEEEEEEDLSDLDAESFEALMANDDAQVNVGFVKQLLKSWAKSKEKDSEEIEIASLQRQPSSQSPPLTFASTTPSPNTRRPSPTHRPRPVIDNERNPWFVANKNNNNNNEEDKLQAGQRLIKGENGELRIKDVEEPPIPFLEMDRVRSRTTTTTVRPRTTSQMEKSVPGFFEKIVTSPSKKVYGSAEEQNDEPRFELFESEAPVFILPSKNQEEEEEKKREEIQPIRIAAYDENADNNIEIHGNTEQTLRQLTTTLRGLTATVMGLNTTIMEATQKVTPKLEVPLTMIEFMQAEIASLSETVEEMREKQHREKVEQREEGDLLVTRQEVKEVLMDVMREAQKVARLQLELSQRGLSTIPPVTTYRPTQTIATTMKAFRERGQKKKFRAPIKTANSIVAGDGVQTHIADNVEWHIVPTTDKETPGELVAEAKRQKEERKKQLEMLMRTRPEEAAGLFEMMASMQEGEETPSLEQVQVFDIPVGASMPVVGGSGGGGTGLPSAVGASFKVGHGGQIIPGSVKNPFLAQPRPRPGFATTMKPLVHTFTPQPAVKPNVAPAAFKVNQPSGFFFPSDKAPAGPTLAPVFHPGPTGATAYPNINGFTPTLRPASPVGGGLWHPTPTAVPVSLSSSNNNNHDNSPYRASNSRPVRFPGGAQHRLDVDYQYLDYFDEEAIEDYNVQPQQPQYSRPPQVDMNRVYSTSYYNSAAKVDDGGQQHRRQQQQQPQQHQALGTPRTGVNIMAELALNNERKNLLRHPHERRPHHKTNEGLEVIVYPSGQLLKGADADHPPSSTIGPKLENALLNKYFRNQLPHYVLAKNNRRRMDDYEEEEEPLPQYEAYQGEDVESGGEDEAEGLGGKILKGLIKTASDDLKLVGNVIKLALS